MWHHSAQLSILNVSPGLRSSSIFLDIDVSFLYFDIYSYGDRDAKLYISMQPEIWRRMIAVMYLFSWVSIRYIFLTLNLWIPLHNVSVDDEFNNISFIL